MFRTLVRLSSPSRCLDLREWLTRGAPLIFLILRQKFLLFFFFGLTSPRTCLFSVIFDDIRLSNVQKHAMVRSFFYIRSGKNLSLYPQT